MKQLKQEVENDDQQEMKTFKIRFAMDFATGVERITITKEFASQGQAEQVIGNGLEGQRTIVSFRDDMSGATKFVHKMKVGGVTITEAE